MNSIIRKNTKEEVVARIVLDEEGHKRCVAYILGATIYCALPREVYIKSKPTDTFIGQVDLVSKMLPNPRYLGKIKTVTGHMGFKKSKKTGDVVEQSPRLDIDRFLYRIKRDLSDHGFKPGDETWERRLNDSTDLYNLINGTNWPRSRDAAIWNTRYKKNTQ